MSITTVGRLFGSKLSLCINEHVLERNHMNAVTVGKLSAKGLHCASENAHWREALSV